MRLSNLEARKVCLTMGFSVKDGAKGTHPQDRGCECPGQRLWTVRSFLNMAGTALQAWGGLWSISAIVLQCAPTCFKMQFCCKFSLEDAAAVALHGPSSSESAQQRQKNAIHGEEVGARDKDIYLETTQLQTLPSNLQAADLLRQLYPRF